ncbi:MAG: hypothetical protein KBO60_17005 [Achromobacter sp.]|nr:hypothetical protein [Achromobacter sp.]
MVNMNRRQFFKVTGTGQRQGQGQGGKTAHRRSNGHAGRAEKRAGTRRRQW